jgi:hypothetical protein
MVLRVEGHPWPGPYLLRNGSNKYPKGKSQRRQIRYRAKKQEMKKLERNLTGLSLQNTRRRVSVVSKIGILIVEKEEKD